jgi:hypothetical protein
MRSVSHRVSPTTRREMVPDTFFSPADRPERTADEIDQFRHARREMVPDAVSYPLIDGEHLNSGF